MRLDPNEVIAELIVECDHVAMSKWLVQAVHRGIWYQEYFAIPPSGGNPKLFPSKVDALKAVLAQILQAKKDAVMS